MSEGMVKSTYNYIIKTIQNEILTKGGITQEDYERITLELKEKYQKSEK